MEAKERQACFFTAEDPLDEPREDPPYDETEPRLAPYRTKWKVHQDAVHRVDLKSAQDQGMVLWETISEAIILNDVVPADCLVKVVTRKNQEILLFKTQPL